MVTWDLPCVNSIQEVDELQQVHDSLSPRGFTLLAISVDKSSDEARVRSFVAAKGWRCPVLLDSTRLSKDLYGVVVKPTGILVSMDTAVVYTHIGYKKGEWEAIRAEILRWLPPGLVGKAPGRRI
jgi:peroxiredoxin